MQVFVVVGTNVGVQEEDVEPFQPHGRKGRVQRPLQPFGDLARRRAAEIALAGEAHADRRRALERRADHRLAVLIERRGVDQVDPAVDRGAHRGDRLVAVGLAPQLAQPAAAEGQAADASKRAEIAVAHRV